MYVLRLSEADEAVDCGVKTKVSRSSIGACSPQPYSIQSGSQTDGEGKYIEYMSGVRGFVTDTAILQGTVKATEMEEKLSEMAKEAMDTAWDSAKNTTQKVEDTLVAEADENVVDTSEYRAIEDLTHRADDGHDHPRDDRIKL
ncbi:hypothetical protein FEM48_Zijuj12G0105100 [Ziziphus jujuba var. spinosa]|uniref:Uncharacterized protein n=1 Tax=Ziziphus jujuba var. spinosa TaxID=714518 RepID=A0A978UCT2_ZIZJJ|nr:hypothetical protein FEM48_Zijuj12G0105100 [Ziziphus jujuba var. spinosa]